MPAATRVHALLEKERTLIFPGVYDALGAKLVERAGFPLSFISGYSVAATQLGLPDFGYLTQTEMVAVAKRVCGDPHHHRCGHGIRQRPERDPHRERADRCRRGRLFPGRSGVAEAVRPHEGEARHPGG
jgi:hypothetical protein